MTKRFLLLLIFFTLAHGIIAQSYQNEWIDYNKTYYKFKVGPFGSDIAGAPAKYGVVRIDQSSLAAAGLGNTPAEQFQLWRDGKEVPVYISKLTGVLSASDYIEFWGETANGKPDKELYSDTTFQLSDYWCLETDSAAYFLTVNSSGNNKRLQTVANNISSVTISPENNFMFTTARYYRSELNGGFHVHASQNLYLSAYDKGEGFSSRPVRRNGSGYGQQEMPQTFPQLYLDTTGSSMTARFVMIGNASYNRNVQIRLNNDSLIQFPMGYYLSARYVVPTPANKIKNDTANFVIQNISYADDDELRVATIELEYPRLFNFGGLSSFEFYLNPSDKGRYLKITNFNKGNANALLCDITNRKRYIADTTTKDTLQFLLQPSSEKYHLVLISGDGSTATVIPTLQQRQFTDFSNQINQGNYFIITNPLLYGTGPNNYVQQYRDYRTSDSGGHFNAKVVDIHELEDQFAYGISMHPLAIKNFLRFARANFATPLAYAFLIGKGISYTAYRYAENNPLTPQLNLIPVFGSPGSDNLLSAENYSDVPATPIGRLSAVTPAEVGAYLDKIKQYELAQRDTSTAITEKLWMKKVLQLADANDASIGYLVDSFQTKYSKIISDTLWGADVLTFSKTADPGSYTKALVNFTNEYNSGSALLEYLGHASSTSIDFNLDDPANYNNQGRYPVFIVNGCQAGNIFDFDANRFNNRSSLSEKFLLEPDRGAIGYLSSSNYAVLDYINLFTRQFYISMASKEYGNGFGNIIKQGINNVINYTGYSDFYARMHAEQFIFSGDPALKINASPLPDFAIDSLQILISPDYISVSSDSFTTKIKIHNLGKAINDSVHFCLLRKFPGGNSDTAFSGKIASIKNTDSVIIKLPVIINRDKGTTIFTAIIDDNNFVREINEKNNSAYVSVKICAADPLPVFPYNYSIVNANTVDLSASVQLDSLTQYVAEVDTTALFNSPLKMSRQQISRGGLITFSDISLSISNTVYYWRVSKDSAEKHWNNSSFTYRTGGNTGFEQAHFYQHTQSAFNGIRPDSSSHAFNFSPAINNLFIQHSIYPTSGTTDAQFSIALNGSIITWSACVGGSVIFNVFDPKTLMPVLNSTLPYNAGPICNFTRRYNFEYSTQSAVNRKNSMDFLDNYVPNGYYVVARKIYDIGNTDWSSVWASDTALYGHNNSLYHRFKDQGLAIDSFNHPGTFIFIFKKNDSAHYEPVSVLSKGVYDRITTSQNISVFDTTATITSPLLGPAISWNKVTWYGTAKNNNTASNLDIVTTDKNGKDSVWFTIDTSQHEFNISTINAADYPYIKLRMNTKDAITTTPYQLKDWKVEFTPVAEGAIATNLGIDIPESLQFTHDAHVTFDSLQGYVVFKNIGSSSFDSLKVKLVLYDEYNIAHVFTLPKTRALAAGDTLHVSFLVNVTDLQQGTYNLYLEVNPNNEQPEQYHYNNFLYHYVRIEREATQLIRKLGLLAQTVNKGVLLQWNVSKELNIASYKVEFSKEGTTFNTVGDVAATNTCTSQKNYSFMHMSPVSGKNYYRIKMINNDGKFTCSPIRISIIENNGLHVYPNPFHNHLNITCNINTESTAELFDLSGRLLLQQKFRAITTLHINHIASGMYILKIRDGINVHSYKVYKK